MIDTVEISLSRVAESRLSEVDFNNIVFGKHYSDHMFVADYANGEWSNLRIEPFAPLQMSPATSTLHYGQSIFEGMKAFKNEAGEVLVFRGEDNFHRLNKSAERMCIPEIPEEIFMGGLMRLLDLDRDWVPSAPGTSLYIRPFVFAADEYIGVKPSDTYKFMIFTSPVGAYYSEPVKVKIEKHFTRAAEGGTGYAKAAGNYAASLYPAKLAQQKGYHQLIWTDGKTHEYIEESGTMNVFFLIDDTLITAPTSDTILAGITRNSVVQLAKDWGVKVEERPVRVDEVVAAAKDGRLKEAFGAGTAATIAHIALIADDEGDYALPPVEGRELSNKLYDTLDAIKTGKVADPHGWVVKV